MSIVIAAVVISVYLLDSGAYNNFLPCLLISSTDYWILFRPY